MRVFSLVAELKGQGMTFAEIHANLQSGQRGEAPILAPNQLTEITTSERESRLELELDQLRQILVRTQQELETVRKIADQVSATKEENIKLQTSLEHVIKERETLEQQVKELSTRIEELAERAGREYARGYIEAIREKGSLPPKE